MSREATRTSGVTRPPAVWASGGTRTSARSRPTPLTTGSRAARSALREERNISGAGGLTGAGATAPPGRSTGRGSARTRTTTTNCSPSWATVRGNQSVFRHHVGESGLLIETDSYCVASTLCDACTYLLVLNRSGTITICSHSYQIIPMGLFPSPSPPVFYPSISVWNTMIFTVLWCSDISSVGEAGPLSPPAAPSCTSTTSY